MGYYHVYAGHLHIDLVQALDEQDACERVFKRFGNPNGYSWASQGQYKAVRA